MTARYIENDMRDYAVGPAPKKGKARKANAIEDSIMHSALRLSLQRIVREQPPAEAAKARDFSVYTGELSPFESTPWSPGGSLRHAGQPSEIAGFFGRLLYPRWMRQNRSHR